jgi:hypothetical protein
LDEIERAFDDLADRVDSTAPEDDPARLQADYIELGQRGVRVANMIGQLGRVDPVAATAAERRIDRFADAMSELWAEMLRKWDVEGLHADRRALIRKREAAPGAHGVYR